MKKHACLLYMPPTALYAKVDTPMCNMNQYFKASICFHLPNRPKAHRNALTIALANVRRVDANVL
jgi:hypothetical protein